MHYPTDINLLNDAVRKALNEGNRLAKQYEIPGWRQYHHNQCVFKNKYRHLQNLRQRRVGNEIIIGETLNYLGLALKHLERAEALCDQVIVKKDLEALKGWMGYISLFTDQIFRRCIDGETIPHNEKIFSIFEPHTEWIVKGKAGIKMELGLRVHVVEDQYQFILYHIVAEKKTDEKLAVDLALGVKIRFPGLKRLSFDKGYHSKENQKELSNILDLLILPKKGRLSAVDKERERQPAFKKGRRQHSAVESAINGLEHMGLDQCPDHGIDGFKRYVSLSVVARNIHRIGVILLQKELENEQRKRGSYKKAA